MADLSQLHKSSFMCRDKIADDTPCGCFYCIRVCYGRDINVWTDNELTPVCPNCHIDSLLPGQTDKALLVEMRDRWFAVAQLEEPL